MEIELASYRCENRDIAEAVRIIIKGESGYSPYGGLNEGSSLWI
jgi:hypothetical protein